METQDLTIPALVMLILIVGLIVGLKIATSWSVVIGLIGFAITYFLMSRGKKK